MAPTVGGALHDAEIDCDPVALARVADGFQVATFDRDRLLDVMRVKRLLNFGLELRAVGAFYPERVTGNQRLTKDGKVRVCFRGLADPLDDLGQGSVAL